MTITLQPLAFVQNSRTEPKDDFWNSISSIIVLADHVPDEALLGLDQFSHLDIIFYFDQVPEDQIVFSGRPRGNPGYPTTGIFGQRKKDRPNRLGLCTVELVKLGKRSITVRRLDAIDGTPVLDIKPVFREFMPQGEIKQPAWSIELMQDYWK